MSTPQYDPSFIAPDFSAKDVISGKTITLYEQDLSNGFVIAFICNHCPYVQGVVKEFSSISERLISAGIPVFAIMSNDYSFVVEDSPGNMKKFARRHNFPFPYLIDEDQSIAQAYGAVCTPDFFAFNTDKEMQFRGRINELENAAMEIKEIGSTTVSRSPSQGCSVKWK